MIACAMWQWSVIIMGQRLRRTLNMRFDVLGRQKSQRSKFGVVILKLTKKLLLAIRLIPYSAQIIKVLLISRRYNQWAFGVRVWIITVILLGKNQRLGRVNILIRAEIKLIRTGQ